MVYHQMFIYKYMVILKNIQGKLRCGTALLLEYHLEMLDFSHLSEFQTKMDVTLETLDFHGFSRFPMVPLGWT